MLTNRSLIQVLMCLFVSLAISFAGEGGHLASVSSASQATTEDAGKTAQWVTNLVYAAWQDPSGTLPAGLVRTVQRDIADRRVIQRFYSVPSDGPFTDVVGFVKVQAVSGGFTMVSVPLEAADNRLNGDEGCIGDMIKEQMVGWDNAVSGDSILMWDAVNKKYSSLLPCGEIGDPAYDGKWLDASTFDVSTLTLAVGDAFWVVRPWRAGGATAQITFLGWVPMEETREVTLYSGLTMFAWPYPTVLPLNTSTLGQVGRGGIGAGAADMVWRWNADTQSYTAAFLISGWGALYDGKWWDETAGEFSDIEFEPGAGFWYLRRDETIIWNCRRPYDRL